MNKHLKDYSISEIYKSLPEDIKELTDKNNLLRINEPNSTDRKIFYKLLKDNKSSYHLTIGSNLDDLYQRSKRFFKRYAKICCRPIGIVELNNHQIFIQDFFEGKPLDKCYLESRINENEIKYIIDEIAFAFNQDEKKSSIDKMNDEVDSIISDLDKNKFLCDSDKIFLCDSFKNELKAFYKDKVPSIRLSTGDFIPRNILIAEDKSFKLIDLEFSSETHFHQEDWIRFSQFGPKDFKKIKIIDDIKSDIPPFIYFYHFLKQIILNGIVLDKNRYETHTKEDLFSATKCSNYISKSSRIIDIFNNFNKKLETEFKIKENESKDLRQVNFVLTKRIEDINERNKLVLGQNISLHNRQISLLNEKLLSAKSEIQILNNKIFRVQRSFSWRSTGFLRLLRRIFIDNYTRKEIREKESTSCNNLNSYKEYNNSIFSPCSHTNKKIELVIIIPVYFAIEYLEKCISSIAKHAKHHHIVIVDDSVCQINRSKIKRIIEKYKIPSDKIIFHYNQLNIGFVQSVNLAVQKISEVANPELVLLLNSDTELTENAIEEMIYVIRKSERHGAVSPRSNNASIQTFPFGQQYDHDSSYQKWKIVKNDIPQYHIIPTCVGFCMLIKYDLIRRYGMFSEIYGRGYNEENDFCCRINRHGYSSISSNHAYVFHYSSKSFSEEDKILLDGQNREKLDHLYPEYSDSVSRFFKNNTNLLKESSYFNLKRIVIDFQDIPNFHNGTSEFALTILSYINQINVNFDLTILINQKAYKFHKRNIPKDIKVLFKENVLDEYFDLCFRPMQFFSRDSLHLSLKISGKLIFVMQDIIAVRTNYLCSNELLEVFSESINKADKIITISKFVDDDCKHYFSKLSFNSEVIYHGLSDDRTSHKDEQYILIIGNKYHHKSLKECLYKVKNINYNFKVIGFEEEFIRSKNIEYIISGNLKEIEVEELYQKCSFILYPSSYEGFGLPICHAIRFSKYIICFENQLNCELFEYFNFFKGIKLIGSFGELEHTISECKDTEIPNYIIPEEFTWKHTSKKYIRAFTDILN